MGEAWYVLGVQWQGRKWQSAEKKGKVEGVRKKWVKNLLNIGVKKVNQIIFLFKILKYNFLQFSQSFNLHRSLQIRGLRFMDQLSPCF